MHPPPSALHELESSIGTQVPLDSYHGFVRRAAQGLRDLRRRGAMLVTCSDEFQGGVRAAFERDVARPLMVTISTGSRRTFSVSNMGGRVEPGALRLANEHFTGAHGGPKLLVVEIAGHCGVLQRGHERTFGQVDRFGRVSACCGALTLLVADHSPAAVVRHPWYDQLTAFFGPDRLADLRAGEASTRLLLAAVVHAVLQCETAIADLVREPPPTPTHVLLLGAVVLNQLGLDEVVPVGVHLLHSDGQELRVVHGASLRSSPGALQVAFYGGRLRVTSDEAALSSAPERVLDEAPAEVLEVLGELDEDQAEPVRLHLARVRREVEHLRRKPELWRVYARPLLRGVIQGLALLSPELALGAMLLQSGHDATRAAQLGRLLKRGPSSAEARRALKAIEAEIQQLGHREAQEVLEFLVTQESSLSGGRP